MRVSTNYSASQALEGIQARQAEQDRLQNQISTGLRVRTPGDDPLAAAQAEMARSRLARNEQDKRAIQFGSSLMASADAALADGVDELQTARESLIAAANPAYGPADRKILAEQLRASRDHLLAIANSRNSAGGYVFSGQGSAGAPASGEADPTFNAPAGEQYIGGQGNYQASLDGRSYFAAVPQGNGVFVTSAADTNTGTATIDSGQVSDATQLTGHEYRISFSGSGAGTQYAVSDITAGTTVVSGAPYQAGAPITMGGERVVMTGAPQAGDSFSVRPAAQQSVFKTLDDAIALLEQPGLTATAFSNRLVGVQTNLDSALDRMILGRSRVGEQMRSMEQLALNNEDQQLQLETLRSGFEDADLATVLSDLKNNQTGLQAALQAYASFSRLSLFDALS